MRVPRAGRTSEQRLHPAASLDLLRDSRRIVRRRWLEARTRAVPITRFLLGGENGWSAAEYARMTGDPRRQVTRLVDGPHVALLRAYQDSPDCFDDDAWLRSTPYAQNALQCIAITGSYFAGRSDADVLTQARAFASWLDDDSTLAPPIQGRTTTGDPIFVRAVRRTEWYEIVDGHHRLARAVVRGDVTARVVVGLRAVAAPRPGDLPATAVAGLR